MHERLFTWISHARHPKGCGGFNRFAHSAGPYSLVVGLWGCWVVGLLGCGVSNTNSNNSNTTKSTQTPTPSTPPTTHQQHHEHQQHQQSKEDKRTPKERKTKHKINQKLAQERSRSILKWRQNRKKCASLPKIAPDGAQACSGSMMVQSPKID